LITKLALGYVVLSQAATATISFDTTHQTIEGMGFFGPMDVWWSGGPFYSDAWLTMILQDLGLTMWRNEYYSEEGSQDANWAKQRPMIEALQAKANNLGVPLKMIYSVWSPPSRWKSNGSLKNGGTLQTQYYDEYGTWLADGVQNYANSGIQLYALSPQNEPAFEEYYNSCVFTAEQYRDMVKIAGPIVHARYPDVKIFGAEDMLSRWTTLGAFPGPLMADLASRAQMGALAVHGYSDGVHPTPASQTATMWNAVARNCKSVGKPAWMTETSGHSADWAGAFEMSECIYAALKFGKIGAWVYWYGAGDLVTSSSLNKKGYASKQFFRYIRPGAEMVQVSDVSASNLFVIAFKHAAERTFTVVVLNSSASAVQLDLASRTGSGLPTQYTLYRTTSSINCASQGTTGNSLSIPASSINTLVATNWDPPAVSVERPAAAARPAAVRSAATHTYDLCGRLVAGSSMSSAALTPGAYCRAAGQAQSTMEVFTGK